MSGNVGVVTEFLDRALSLFICPLIRYFSEAILRWPALPAALILCDMTQLCNTSHVHMIHCTIQTQTYRQKLVKVMIRVCLPLIRHTVGGEEGESGSLCGLQSSTL